MTSFKRKKGSTSAARSASSFILALATCAAIAGPQTAPPALARPEGSGIQVAEEHIDNKPYQVCRVLVKARPEQVWQIITDYSGAPNVFTTLRKVQVLLDRGSSKIVHYEMRPTGVMATFQYDLEIREQPYRELRWHRVSGDFKAVEGYWKLEPVDGGRNTVVTYATHVNGGLLMPQALIRHQSHVDLPTVMAALREHAESNVRIASGSRISHQN